MAESESGPKIDLYVRSLCPTGARQRQERVIERLNAMEEEDRLAEFSVTVWGKRAPCDGRTAIGEALLDRLDAFETWSERAGTSLSSFFETCEPGSFLTDEPREAIVLPTLCLAEYRGDDLRYVAPCVDDGTVCTIPDRLDVLEGGPRWR